MNLKLIFLLGVISFIVYANTFKDGYVLDDQNIIQDNSFVKNGISAIPKILVTPYRQGWIHLDNDFYRPLSVATFAMEYQLFGLNPATGHFVNVLLFACCVILLFLFFDKLFAGSKTAVAFIAALLFALHPIHTEVVANIKSRDELLCFFFAFLCLNVYIRYMGSGRISQLLLGAFCFLLALLSKETVITFLVIIPFIFFFYRNENKKHATYITISAAFSAIIYLSARFMVLSVYHANNVADVGMIENALANQHISYESKIATAILIMGYYVKLLFIPYPLICDYSYNTIPYTHFSSLLVLFSLSFYVFLVLFSARRLLRNKKDPYSFGGH